MSYASPLAHVPRSFRTAVSRLGRRALRTLSHARGVPEWFAPMKRMLHREAHRWEMAKTAAAEGPKVLIATSVGGKSPCMALESLLAVALTLRGARVHLALCDGVLGACLHCVSTSFPDQREFAEYGPSTRLCRGCYSEGIGVYRTLGLPIHSYGDFVTAEEIGGARKLSAIIPMNEIEAYSHRGTAVGEHAMAGALRYFARGTLDEEPFAESVLRRYFFASLVSTFAIRRLIGSFQYRSAAFHHGIYVPQGLIAEEARRAGLPVATWSVAYRKKRFIFSHGDTYHHTLLSEPSSAWEGMAWDGVRETAVMDYLKSRWNGSRDWIWFHENPVEDAPRIFKELDIDPSRPMVGLLTNVMWDAQLHYRANAFKNMLEWLVQTIRYFAARPEIQLIVRVHPAEIRGSIPSRQRITDEIRRHFTEIPPNIFVIPPESPVSTYAVMMNCNAAIIYGTKTGVELASMGIPVIVAGEAWIRNKGITLDASTPEEYFGILDRLPFHARMDDARTARARMYTYHFFFRRMIPVKVVEPTNGWPPFRPVPQCLEDLAEGKDPGLDTICNGILHGSDFIYPAELLPDAAE